MTASPSAVGTDPATPCGICGEPLNPEYPTFTRTVHPKCADKRAAAYVAAGRPWKQYGETLGTATATEETPK